MHAWASRHHVECVDRRDGMLIACVDVDARTLADRPGETGAASSVDFAFRPVDHGLVNITVTTFGLSPPDAMSRYAAARMRLEKTNGTSDVATEPPTLDRLDMPYATSTIAYRYADYLAEVEITNLPTRGVTVREHYLSGTTNDGLLSQTGARRPPSGTGLFRHGRRRTP